MRTSETQRSTVFNHLTVSAAANAATCAVVRVGSLFLRPAGWFGSEERFGSRGRFFSLSRVPPGCVRLQRRWARSGGRGRSKPGRRDGIFYGYLVDTFSEALQVTLFKIKRHKNQPTKKVGSIKARRGPPRHQQTLRSGPGGRPQCRPAHGESFNALSDPPGSMFARPIQN